MQEILKAYAETPAIAREIGYEMKTTYWGDFTVAERIDGETGIRDTFRRTKAMWDNKEMATELALVLNWKAWQHQNDQLCQIYSELYDKLDGYIMDNWKGENLEYYLRTTD